MCPLLLFEVGSVVFYEKVFVLSDILDGAFAAPFGGIIF